MRESDLLAPTLRRSSPGPRTHDGTIVTQRPDEMWAIDGTSCMTVQGSATVFVVIDHCTDECLGACAAKCGTLDEAIDTLRQAIRATRGTFDRDVAAGGALRHDHGSQFISHAFQDELRFVGIRSSSLFVRIPEGNGCVEGFIRTLKEQLLCHTIRQCRRTARRVAGIRRSFQQPLDPRASWIQNARIAPTQFPRGGRVIYANTCVNNGILCNCVSTEGGEVHT